MEAYFAAKARLFSALRPEASVVHVDDAHGARLAATLDAARRTTVSRRPGAGADLSVEEGWSQSRRGIAARLRAGPARASLASPLLGAHNLDNLLVAAGILLALGVALPDAARALGGAPGAPGRLERVGDEAADGLVLVDYAHTPDAVARALAALRPLTPGRLLVVLGCGGDRDAEKRPLMGRAAAEGADLAILTSDNPRTEDPFAILRAMEPGVVAAGARRVALAELAGAGPGAYAVEEDRRAAIGAAVAAAGEGDTLLIAGKGHEDYQIRGTERLPFDDRVEARAALARRARRRSS
jgi:UDP-N-acetylmuramoyl-L-alanyl-D-glutamate--2,6-diaminopimelate ligase